MLISFWWSKQDSLYCTVSLSIVLCRISNLYSFYFSDYKESNKILNKENQGKLQIKIYKQFKKIDDVKSLNNYLSKHGQRIFNHDELKEKIVNTYRKDQKAGFKRNPVKSTIKLKIQKVYDW